MNTKETLEALNKSIEHWKTMIAWVKEQSPRGRGKVSVYNMAAAVDQSWFGEDCAICVTDCKSCPLGMAYGPCGGDGENAWGGVVRASTWGTWLRHAEKLLGQLKRAKSIWIKKQEKPGTIPGFVQCLIKAGACSDSIKWLLRRKFKTLQEAWDVCKHGVWMMWLLERCGKKGYKFSRCWTEWSILTDSVVEANMIRRYYPKAPKLPKKIVNDEE